MRDREAINRVSAFKLLAEAAYTSTLTLLTGFNAAGKSTALQPLLLLAQAAKLNRRREPTVRNIRKH